MNSRRQLIKQIFAIGATLVLPTQRVRADVKPMRKLLQISPVAGFQYYQGETLWAQLKQGARLTLSREPENNYDARAVRIDFNGQKLGYLPRLDNAAVSQLLDRGEQVQAYINATHESDDPWKRVMVEVRWII